MLADLVAQRLLARLACAAGEPVRPAVGPYRTGDRLVRFARGRIPRSIAQTVRDIRPPPPEGGPGPCVPIF